MDPDPQQIFHELGAVSSPILLVDTLSEEHGHRVWRVVTAERSYILKWLPEKEAKEVQGYLLMQEIGVPTLPLYGNTAQALLLEDLGRSEEWRLAVAVDVERAAVGRAVARWYQLLHHAGEEFLAQKGRPGFLTRETDELSPETLLATGRRFGLSGYPAWGLAIEQIELLKAAVGKLSVTLNYNDFYWTNLALSRQEEGELKAIVFDYHLLGIGMRFSDCRNVAGSLSGAARSAFWDTYGEIDPREQLLDRPLSTLYGLYEAARMAKFPPWAEGCREQAASGELEREIEAAVDVAQRLLVR